jgi:hypothetical protein
MEVTIELWIYPESVPALFPVGRGYCRPLDPLRTLTLYLIYPKSSVSPVFFEGRQTFRGNPRGNAPNEVGDMHLHVS